MPGSQPGRLPGHAYAAADGSRLGLAVTAARPLLAATIAAFFALAVGLGCSTVESPDAYLVPPESPAQATPSLPFRVGFLPLIVDDAYRSRLAEINSEANPTHEHAFLPDAAERIAIVRETVDALGQLRACREVAMIEVDPIVAEGSMPPGLLRQAWDDGFDLVVRPVLRQYACDYVGHNDAYVPTLLMWIIVLQLPTWWIADETFGAGAEISLEVYATAGGPSSPMVRRTIASSRIERDLDDFGQGFNLFNPFITPSGLSDEHWNDIGDSLLPLARQDLQRQLIDAVRDVDAGLARDLARQREQLQRHLAVLIGTRSQPALGRRYAVEDVIQMNDLLLRSPASQVVDERSVAMLDGSRATTDAARRAIADLLETRAREDDRALLFFAQQGMIDAEGNAYLLFIGSDPDALDTTAMPVSELAERLSRCEAPVAVLSAVEWYDATGEVYLSDQKDQEAGGFGEDDQAPQPIGPADAIDPWQALAALDHVVVIASSLPEEGVLELASAGSSLFVHQLSRTVADYVALDDAAPEAQTLSWQALFGQAEQMIGDIAMLEDGQQTPILTGSDAAADTAFFAAQ